MSTIHNESQREFQCPQFQKKVCISPQYADFLNVERSAKISRIETHRLLFKFIHANNLKNGLNIITQNGEGLKIKKLLLNDDAKITIFNLPENLRHHFDPLYTHKDVYKDVCKELIEYHLRPPCGEFNGGRLYMECKERFLFVAHHLDLIR
jgi:hypothetical protein